MILSISGWIGSGKDTVAKYLQDKYDYQSFSFAASLKDAISAIFGWDRELLQGQTNESRLWREKVDVWWAERLNIPHLSPRWVLQHWGTEVCRVGFHDEIWIASLENKLRKSNNNIVISDARFANELSVVKKLGGKSLRIIRGPEPEWYTLALKANFGDVDAKKKLEKEIHSSEWAWIGYDFDQLITNDTTIEDLYQKIDFFVKNQL